MFQVSLGIVRSLSKIKLILSNIDPFSELRLSSIFGMGKAWNFVTEFRPRKSTHGRTSPSLLATGTSGELHADFECLKIPTSVMSLICLLILSFCSGPILLGGCRWVRLNPYRYPVAEVCNFRCHSRSNLQLPGTYPIVLLYPSDSL